MTTREDITDVLGRIESLRNSALSRVEQLLNTLGSHSRHRAEIRKEYGIDRTPGFNFFASISDFHRRETFHSDILALLLNPHTETIGNPDYLPEFFAAVEEAGLRSGKSISIQVGRKGRVTVQKEIGQKETGRIDLLLHDGTRAVIIENKINDAVDQPDQLPRYLEYCRLRKEGPLAVDAIVYLPRVWKNPPVEYSEKHRHLINEVQALSVVVPAIGPREGAMRDRCIDLGHDILDRFKRVADTHKTRDGVTASVYIEQYASLVKHIGGNAVAKENSKAILRELLSTEDSIRTTRDIAEVWEQRSELIPRIVFEMLTRKEGMKAFPGHAGVLTFRDLPGGNGKGYTVAYDEDEGSVGFLADSADGLGQAAELNEILGSVDFGSSFGEIQNNQWWVWRGLDVTTVSEPIDSLVDRIYDILKALHDTDRKRRARK
jgi:hypothetical protein